MSIACKYCLLPGESGVSRAKGNIFETDEELFAHIESQHHIPVRSENESEAETLARFRREQPDAGGPNCRCPACKRQTEALALIDKMQGMRA